jgi:hypothetical protein
MIAAIPAAAVDLDILLVLFVTPFSFVIGQSRFGFDDLCFHHIRRMSLATRSSANIDAEMKESISTEVERYAVCVYEVLT